jgi:hypothetical protein
VSAGKALFNRPMAELVQLAAMKMFAKMMNFQDIESAHRRPCNVLK